MNLLYTSGFYHYNDDVPRLIWIDNDENSKLMTNIHKIIYFTVNEKDSDKRDAFICLMSEGYTLKQALNIHTINEQSGKYHLLKQIEEMQDQYETQEHESNPMQK